MKYGHWGVLTCVAFLYFGLQNYLSHFQLLLWSGFTIAAIIPRQVTVVLFRRKLEQRIITPENITKWEYYLAAASAFLYLILVSIIFISAQQNQFAAVLLCAFVFALLALGAVMTLNMSKLIASLMLSSMLLPSAVSFMWVDASASSVLAACTLIAFAQTLNVTIRINKTMVKNVSLKIENMRSSMSDPLTGLANRRSLTLFVEQLVPAAIRRKEAFCLIIADIDHFKHYNDLHGHNAGDLLIKDVANIIAACARDEDLAVRYGGEEFLLVLPRTDLTQGLKVAERMRQKIETDTTITSSFGLAQFSLQESFESVIKRADVSLYVAKRDGRNKVEADSISSSSQQSVP
jgi:diguanylate cyclase (GGDEF)-like protein